MSLRMRPVITQILTFCICALALHRFVSESRTFCAALCAGVWILSSNEDIEEFLSSPDVREKWHMPCELLSMCTVRHDRPT